MRTPRPHLDHAAVAVLAALFLTAQFGWLPLGILAGQTRYVPIWSKCGQALCHCTPTPYCPLCKDTKTDPDATCLRLDLSGTRAAHETLIALIDSIVGVPPTPDRSLETLFVPEEHHARIAQLSTPYSRTLGVPPPPPRA